MTISLQQQNLDNSRVPEYHHDNSSNTVTVHHNSGITATVVPQQCNLRESEDYSRGRGPGRSISTGVITIYCGKLAHFSLLLLMLCI